jgi:hypothetical protein
MERRFFLKSGLAATGLLASNISLVGAHAQNKEELQSGTIIHSVYFWLKKGISKADEQQFLAFFEVLRKLPGVKSLIYGKAAGTTKRVVTDNTFDYNLIVTFENLEAIKIYETHPDHLKGAEAFSKYWDKVQVRDTVMG